MQHRPFQIFDLKMCTSPSWLEVGEEVQDDNEEDERAGDAPCFVADLCFGLPRFMRRTAH